MPRSVEIPFVYRLQRYPIFVLNNLARYGALSGIAEYRVHIIDGAVPYWVMRCRHGRLEQGCVESVDSLISLTVGTCRSKILFGWPLRSPIGARMMRVTSSTAASASDFEGCRSLIYRAVINRC